MNHHYIESGLDNIYLENGFTLHQTPYGEGVSIQDTAELHKVIGRWLVSLPKGLTGAELRFLRLEMGMTQKDLAAVLNADEQAVRRWEKAREKPFNGSADRLLRALYLEYIDGDGAIRSLVDRLAELDEIEYAEACFQETDLGWKLAA